MKNRTDPDWVENYLVSQHEMSRDKKKGKASVANVLSWKQKMVGTQKIPLENVVNEEAVAKALLQKQGQFCAAWLDETGHKPSESELVMESRDKRTVIFVQSRQSDQAHLNDLERMVRVTRELTKMLVGNFPDAVGTVELEKVLAELRRHRDIPDQPNAMPAGEVQL